MKRQLANTLGTFGYMSLSVQWVWLVITTGMPLLSSSAFKDLFLPGQTTEVLPAASLSVPEPIAVLFSVLAVIFAVGLTIYVIVSIPRVVGRTGKTVTTKSAQVILPHITHHKKVSEKRQKRLMERITWSMKIGLALLPLLALVIPLSSDVLELSREVVSGVAIFCASATLLWFGAQFTVVRLAKIDSRDVW